MKSAYSILPIATVAVSVLIGSMSVASAQPLKFRNAGPPAIAASESVERESGAVRATEPNHTVRHTHRRGSGSPRSVVVAATGRGGGESVRSAASVSRERVRFGPRSKSRVIIRPVDTDDSGVSSETGVPRRAAGPPVRPQGRR